MEIIEKIQSRFWLLYFCATIVLIGGICGYLATAPFLLLGFRVPFFQRYAERRMLQGLRLLMSAQPWLNLQSAIPDELGQPLGVGAKGCLLVSNHRSHLDVFLLISRIQGLRILAKSSLFSVPFLGAMMRMTRQIPARRGQVQSFVSAMEIVKAQLQQGERVHIFPELTRCPPGFEGTQSFILAPFHAAIQAQVPVIPIVIKGTDVTWPKGSARIAYRAPMQVFSLPAIDPGAFTSAEALRDQVKLSIDQALSQSALMEAV